MPISVPMVHFYRAPADTTVTQPYVSVPADDILAIEDATLFASVAVLGPYLKYEPKGEVVEYIDGEKKGIGGFCRTFSIKCATFKADSADDNSVSLFYSLQRNILDNANLYYWVDLSEIQERLDWHFYHTSGHLLPVVVVDLQTEDNEDGTKGMTIVVQHRWNNK